MEKIRLGVDDWVVVCDGRRAMILENRGDAQSPNLRKKETYEHPDPPTHELGTDRPGRLSPSVGTARSAVGQTDWHDESERAFLKQLAHRLDAAVTSGEVSKLIIAASPRALGMLRPAFTPAVRHAVKSEIHKDYLKMPIAEIEKALVG
jgi:protein required for attachment to host cells